jgi:syntaxin 5
MPTQDRTNEFRACVDSIRTRSAPGVRAAAESRQRLLHSRASGSKSEFSRTAAAIGRDISSASLKLNKLAQRAYPRMLTFCWS